MTGGFKAAFFGKKSDEEELTHLGSARVFKYGELKKATKSFATELGVGGFGSVYLGTLRDGRKVAVKLLHNHNPKRLQQFLDEIIVFSRLRHKNLVTLHGCTNPPGKELLLVYDYVPNSTVDDHLHGKRSDLTLAIRVQIAMETAEALVYLHALDPPVIHRDVKPPNIMLDDGFHVKLCDLGLCRLLPWNSAQVLTEAQGTLGYRDPEYDRTCILTVKSDVYSFGMMLVELISAQMVVDVNRPPGSIYLADFALNKIVNKKLDNVVDSKLGYNNNTHHKRVINSLADLAVKCLHQTGIKRPTMEQVLRELKNIDNELQEKQVLNANLINELKNIDNELQEKQVLNASLINELKNIDNELQEKQVLNASLINGRSRITCLTQRFRAAVIVPLMIILRCLWYGMSYCKAKEEGGENSGTSMIRSLVEIYSDLIDFAFMTVKEGGERSVTGIIAHLLAIYGVVVEVPFNLVKGKEEGGEHSGTSTIRYLLTIYSDVVRVPVILSGEWYFKAREGGEYSGTSWIRRLKGTYLPTLFLLLALAVALFVVPLILILCCLWYYTSLTLVPLILISCYLGYYTSLSLLPLLRIVWFYKSYKGQRGRR